MKQLNNETIMKLYIKITKSYKKKVNYCLFLLLVFFLPTQFGRHFFFDFSYLSGVRVDYLAPTIYMTDILVIILAVLNWKIIFNFFKNRKLVFLILLFLINIYFAQSIPLAFYRFIKIIEFFVLIAIAQRFVGTGRDLSLLFILTISTLLETTLATLQLLSKHSLQGIFYFLGERHLALSTPGIAKGSFGGAEILRAYGTFSHPNSLAGFYLVLYFFVLTFQPFNINKYLKNIFLFLATILIFISFSKIAIITFVSLNLLYFVRKIKMEKICQFCTIPKMLIPFIVAFIFLGFKSDPLSFNKRLELFNNSLIVISNNWLMGTGIGNYLIAQDQLPSHYLYFFQQPVHNIFLLFISEFGILISVIIFSWSWSFIKKSLKNEVFLFLLLAVFATGLFDHYWLTLQQNFLLLATVIGVINFQSLSLSARSSSKQPQHL